MQSNSSIANTQVEQKLVRYSGDSPSLAVFPNPTAIMSHTPGKNLVCSMNIIYVPWLDNIGCLDRKCATFDETVK